MKVTNQKVPSIYDQKHIKKPKQRINFFKFIMTLLLLLVAVRFINLSMWWMATNYEIENNTNKSFRYYPLHFSNSQTAKDKCTAMTIQYPPYNVNVVGYFNLFQSAIFFIENKERNELIDLGRMMVQTTPGFSIYKFHLLGMVEKLSGNTIKQSYFDNSLIAKDLYKITKSGKRLNFISKPIYKTSYLKIPYYIYFFLPLVLIVIFAIINSPAVFASFFYYPMLFLFFDFKMIFFQVPFQWLFNFLNIRPSTLVEIIMICVLVSFFVLMGILGFKQSREKQNRFLETLLITFFILLPIILRF